MSCGSKGLYTQIVTDGCEVSFVSSSTSTKKFDVFHTVVTESSSGNLKLISKIPDITVILSASDLLDLGFASNAAFMTYWAAARCACLACADAPPPAPETVVMPSTTLDNGQNDISYIPSANAILGSGARVSVATDLKPLFDLGIKVTWEIITNGFLTVIVENNHDEDDYVVPPITFNIYP